MDIFTVKQILFHFLHHNLVFKVFSLATYIFRCQERTLKSYASQVIIYNTSDAILCMFSSQSCWNLTSVTYLRTVRFVGHSSFFQNNYLSGEEMIVSSSEHKLTYYNTGLWDICFNLE